MFHCFSQVLKVCSEVIKHEELPVIDDNKNHLEVAEYVDDIYQYYWVMEVMFALILSIDFILSVMFFIF